MAIDKKYIKETYKNEKTNSELFDELDGGFGKYQESTGGGHPFKKGSSNTRTTRENGKYRQQHNPNTDQPRTADGKFTYNSVNGKGLKQPSRGTTVNPLLTGGENGIHYKGGKNNKSTTEDVRSRDEWIEWSESHQWYEKGGAAVDFEGKIKLSPASLMDIARRYNPETKKFEQEDVQDWKTKKRASKYEQGFIDEAKKEGLLGRVFIPARPDKPTESGIEEFGKLEDAWKQGWRNIMEYNKKRAAEKKKKTPTPVVNPIQDNSTSTTNNNASQIKLPEENNNTGGQQQSDTEKKYLNGRNSNSYTTEQIIDVENYMRNTLYAKAKEQFGKETNNIKKQKLQSVMEDIRNDNKTLYVVDKKLSNPNRNTAEDNGLRMKYDNIITKYIKIGKERGEEVIKRKEE